MQILRCMGSNFIGNFKRALWKIALNFEPKHRKISILQGVEILTNCDILELWHLKS